MRFAIWLLLAGLFGVHAIHAAQYYAAPTGTGNGTLLAPWSLPVALTNAAIAPGDTLWLRAGTYADTYTALLNGNLTNRITIRNYNEERAILDGSLNTGSSSNLWLWGLEFIDSKKTNRPAPYNTITMQGTGTAIVNCLIHDCCIGIAPHGAYLIYGNLLWNCGKDAGLEHAMYLQNEVGKPAKLIQDNLVGRASGFGIHIYGSSGGMASLHLLHNTIWQVEKYAILFGGGQPITDGQVISNYIYSPLGSGALRLGYGVANADILVQGNYLHGRQGVLLSQQFSQLTFTNNILESVDSSSNFNVKAPGFTNISGTVVWDFNQYYKQNFGSGRNYYFQLDTNTFLGAGWTNATGFDVHSFFNSAGYPLTGSNPPDLVVVRPNAYEAKRGHVIIYNFTGSNNVPVDVSSILAPGDNYVVRSALNYFAGPVLSGIYAGGTISLPMTNQTLAVDPYYANPGGFYNTTTNFNAFVVMKAPNNAPALPTQVNRMSNELTLLTVTNTASDNDWPANLLSYQLLVAPSGAQMDGSGVITWTPTAAQGSSTNTFTTVVTDNGTPPLSATNSFQVIVNRRARLSLLSKTNNTVNLGILGRSNIIYTLQFSSNLTDWVAAQTTNSAFDIFQLIDTNAPTMIRIYRIRQDN